MFSTDQSFPLAGAVAYSVYMYQAKRSKRNPEGPFLGGNPMVGAIITTVFNLGFACGVRVEFMPGFLLKVWRFCYLAVFVSCELALIAGE